MHSVTSQLCVPFSGQDLYCCVAFTTEAVSDRGHDKKSEGARFGKCGGWCSDSWLRSVTGDIATPEVWPRHVIMQ